MIIFIVFLQVYIYFLDWKKHSCSQQAYIANDQVSSRQQSCKTTEIEDTYAYEGR